MIKQCKYCGKQFDTSNTDGQRKYCSKECAANAKKAYIKAYCKAHKRTRTHKPKQKKTFHIEKYCAVCGEKFTPRGGNQICCSKECSYKRKIKTSRESNKRYRARNRRKKRILQEFATKTPRCESKGIEYQFLTPEQKIFYGETQMKAYADDFKVIIPEGLKKAKDRQSEKAAL